jgi:hypothetical protein
LVVDAHVVERLSFGAITNLVAIFVGVKSLDRVWIRVLLLILSSSL